MELLNRKNSPIPHLTVFPTYNEFAFSGWGMVQRDVWKYPSKRVQSPFNKFHGISRSHCHHPDVEEDLNKGMMRHFVFHEQYHPIGAYDALHFLQGSLPGRPFQFIQRMGAGDDIKTLISKGEGCRIPLYQDNFPGGLFVSRFTQHSPGKIIANGYALGIAIGKRHDNSSSPAANIENRRVGCPLRVGHLDQKVPRISGISTRMQIHKSIIHIRENIIVDSSSGSYT